MVRVGCSVCTTMSAAPTSVSASVLGLNPKEALSAGPSQPARSPRPPRPLLAGHVLGQRRGVQSLGQGGGTASPSLHISPRLWRSERLRVARSMEGLCLADCGEEVLPPHTPPHAQAHTPQMAA